MSNLTGALTEALENLFEVKQPLHWEKELTLAISDGSANYHAEINLNHRDGLSQIGLCLSHPSEPWCHTACTIALYPEHPVLRGAFAVDVQNYVLPQDLAIQEGVTRKLAQALDDISSGPLHNADLGQLLRTQMQASTDRLRTLWEDQRRKDVGAEKLSYLVEGPKKNEHPAVVAPSTRPGVKRPIGVTQGAPDLPFSTLSRFTGKTHDWGYYTRERLKNADRFSAHEQFDILLGQGLLHEAAMREFHKVRLNNNIRPYPFPPQIGVAHIKKDWATFQANISLLTGDSGLVYFSQDRDTLRNFTVTMSFPDQCLDIKIQLEKGKLTIGRTSVHETRFSKPGLLDELLTEVIKMLIAVDPIWPCWGFVAQIGLGDSCCESSVIADGHE